MGGLLGIESEWRSGGHGERMKEVGALRVYGGGTMEFG